MKLLIVGCGNIATSYVRDIKAHAGLEIVGFTDVDHQRAESFAREHGGTAYPDLTAALADPAVEMVVNLTIFEAHYTVVKQALEAGKHVYSEKPLALKYQEAEELVRLAHARGLRLACAPITFLGEAQQTALKQVRSGELGTVRLVYAEVNQGRIESWHPNPGPFYAVGPNLDVGVYPLSITTAVLGRVARLSAYARTLYPQRVTKEGIPFTITAPDYYVINLEFESGPVMRLTTNFYVSKETKGGKVIEFHGDKGSLALESWFESGVRVEQSEFGKPYHAVPLLRPASSALDWARGVQDFSQAIESGRPARVTGEHAAHVVEILDATNRSVADGGQPVTLHSDFPLPDPMDWAR